MKSLLSTAFIAAALLSTPVHAHNEISSVDGDSNEDGSISFVLSTAAYSLHLAHRCNFAERDIVRMQAAYDRARAALFKRMTVEGKAKWVKAEKPLIQNGFDSLGSDICPDPARARAFPDDHIKMMDELVMRANSVPRK